MSSLITRSNAAMRSRESSVSLIFEPTTGTWNGIVFMRTQRGVFFLESPFGSERPDMNTVYLNAFMRGQFSKRPYRLGEAVDSSLENCILALFHDLCAVHELKAHGLAQLALPERAQLFTEADFLAIVAQARWEDYISPDHWTATDVVMLYQALNDLGYGALGSLMGSVLYLPAP
ncbi:MAG: hypothetical protein SXG53_26625 [Pseudomonadota bacterium]|nr:hypothetical protein [Pseudomonadota bacterium]